MKLTDIIYSVITDKDILSHYLKISKNKIEFLLLNSTNRISNPLRVDNNPSMGMMEITKNNRKRIKVRDFANSSYNGDAYSIAGIVLNKNSNNTEDFKFICQDIMKNIILNNNDIHTIFTKKIRKARKKSNTEITLTINYKEWDNHDLKFWYNITKDKQFTKLLYENLLIEKVGIPKTIYYGENLLIYEYKSSDRAYVYFYNLIGTNTKCKIYFPDRITGTSLFRARFITNDKLQYRGLLSNTGNSTTMIMTKSFKDAIFIKAAYLSLYPFFSPTGTSIPHIYYVQGESNLLTAKSYAILRANYDTKIWLMDYDYTGIFNTYYHVLLDNTIIPIFIKSKQVYFKPNDFTAIRNKVSELLNVEITDNNIRRFMKSFKVRTYYKNSKDFTDLLENTNLTHIYKLIKFFTNGYFRRPKRIHYKDLET